MLAKLGDDSSKSGNIGLFRDAYSKFRMLLEEENASRPRTGSNDIGMTLFDDHNALDRPCGALAKSILIRPDLSCATVESDH